MYFSSFLKSFSFLVEKNVFPSFTLDNFIFFAEKKKKNVKLKKSPGHGGIRRACLRSQSKRSETQKTEFALGNHIKNTFFERNKNELKKLEK